MHILEELIVVGVTRLSIQQREMEGLEEFYLKFNKGQDGGSSLNANPLVEQRLRTIIEKCKIKENILKQEKRGLEEACSRLKCFNEMKDQSPLDQSLLSDPSYVDVKHLTCTSKAVDLKKLASLKRLEKKFEASMDHRRTHINLQRLYKKF